MPIESQFAGNSIEELLVALANGVREAQMALNDGPLVDASGRPLSTYHLPHLDFSVNVSMTTQSSNVTGGRPIMFLRAAGPSGEARNVTSTISGRLVAIPPGDGLPVPRLSLSTGGNQGGKASIAIMATNSAGEMLVNQTIELNIDEDASRRLSAAQGGEFKRQGGTHLTEAILTTGADGQALTSLLIDREQSANEIIVVTANIGSFSAHGAIPLGTLS